MSPYLQELVVFTGQNMVYQDASEQLERSNSLLICPKQIERITDRYGELSSGEEAQLQEDRLNQKYETSKEEPLYCMMDGSMVLTREDSWKEVKLARIFSEKDRLSSGKKRTFLRSSEYVGHLGGVGGFFKKMDGMAGYLEQAVFIADGAKWIGKWVSGHYPKSTQILDFYHAKEKLAEFAKLSLEEEEKETWIKIQSNLLLANGVKKVLKNIENCPTKGRQAAQRKRSLLTYFENNSTRMQYKTYLDKGLLIGSGAIESAHRTVVQARMKRSGQRWSIHGAQNILNLRTLNKSGQWSIVQNLIAA